MSIHVPAQRPAPARTQPPLLLLRRWPGSWAGVGCCESAWPEPRWRWSLSLVVWSLLPLLAGWTPRVILSGSMEPRIHVGDIVVTRTVPAATLTKGQVITVKDPDHPEQDAHPPVACAVTRTACIVTKGDANPQADSSHVSDDDVLGLGVVRVPFVGRPAYWMAERNWLALGATTLFLGWCLVTAAAGSRRTRGHPTGDRRPTARDPRTGSRPPRVRAGSPRPSPSPPSPWVPRPARPTRRSARTACNPASTWTAAATFVTSYSQTVLSRLPSVLLAARRDRRHRRDRRRERPHTGR